MPYVILTGKVTLGNVTVIASGTAGFYGTNLQGATALQFVNSGYYFSGQPIAMGQSYTNNSGSTVTVVRWQGSLSNIQTPGVSVGIVNIDTVLVLPTDGASQLFMQVASVSGIPQSVLQSMPSSSAPMTTPDNTPAFYIAIEDDDPTFPPGTLVPIDIHRLINDDVYYNWTVISINEGGGSSTTYSGDACPPSNDEGLPGDLYNTGGSVCGCYLYFYELPGQAGLGTAGGRTCVELADMGDELPVSGNPITLGSNKFIRRTA